MVSGLVGETPYVLFLDSDDMLEKTYSEQLIWLLESNEEGRMPTLHCRLRFRQVVLVGC